MHTTQYIDDEELSLQAEQEEKYIFLKWKFSSTQKHLVSISGNL
jgi:hypothetical protein